MVAAPCCLFVVFGIDHWLAGLVNDFKKSLKTISGHAEMLMRENESEASRYYAEKILSEAESLSRIVSEFLEFASSAKN